jgi:hypothetical protein
MNFAKGILESRTQTYRNLTKLLKPLALETPTVIELTSGNEIRVTLFDANHCIGSVMFLIEGRGKAVLYTGDVRSEPWWVNSLVQNPVLLPYASGIRQLDNIYLDTTFAATSYHFREFPSKRSGVEELLAKVSKYPPDTCFYFQSWTFGYENVWVALSSFLKSQIHLDRYRWELYSSLSTIRDGPGCRETSQLCGYDFGNHFRPGCLTPDHGPMIHSCERGGGCPVIDGGKKCVRIIPIVTRLQNGREVHEMGIGGGNGDMDQAKELEMEDAVALQNLVDLCKVLVKDEQKLAKVVELVISGHRSRDGGVRLPTHLIDDIDDGVKLEQLVSTLVGIAGAQHEQESQAACSRPTPPTVLPDAITFCYSRHSSYSELCLLVGAFKPLDVYPCTVDERNWTPRDSMQSLFGHLCSGTAFRHDGEMLLTCVAQESQRTENTQDSDATESIASELASQDRQAVPAGEDVSSTDLGNRSRTATDSPETLRTPSRKRRRSSQDSSPSAEL